MASIFGHGVVGFTVAKVIDNKNLKMSCEDCKCKIKLIEEITLSQAGICGAKFAVG